MNCFHCKCRCDLETGCLIIGVTNIITNIIWIMSNFYFEFNWHKTQLDILHVLIILPIIQAIISLLLIIGIKKKKTLFIDFWMFNVFMSFSIQSIELCMHVFQYLVYDENLGEVVIESINMIPIVIMAFLIPFVWKFRNEMSFEHRLFRRNNDFQLKEGEA